MKNKDRLDAIEKRQLTIKKWIADYDNCSYEEDLIASRAFDPMVYDIDFLLSRVKTLTEALDRIACWSETSECFSGFDEPGSAQIARKALGDE